MSRVAHKPCWQYVKALSRPSTSPPHSVYTDVDSVLLPPPLQRWNNIAPLLRLAVMLIQTTRGVGGPRWTGCVKGADVFNMAHAYSSPICLYIFFRSAQINDLMNFGRMNHEKVLVMSVTLGRQRYFNPAESRLTSDFKLALRVCCYANKKTCSLTDMILFTCSNAWERWRSHKTSIRFALEGLVKVALIFMFLFFCCGSHRDIILVLDRLCGK